MARIVVIDYGAGNLHSVCAGFRRVMQPEHELVLSANPAELERASHIVLPGVGAFKDCITALKACNGMIDALEEAVLRKKQPFLGICVGMQMLLEYGLEHGRHEGLGWIGGEVAPIEATSAEIRIPHMGWNELQLHQPSSVTEGIASGEHAYFVHSYYARLTDEQHMIASTDYGKLIPAIIGKDNIIGTQFHPEKSQQLGAKILENFLKME